MTSDVRIILAVLTPPKDAEAVLTSAQSLAQRLDAQVEAVYAKADWTSVSALTPFAYSPTPELLDQIAKEAADAEAKAQATFERLRAAAPSRFGRFHVAGADVEAGLALAARTADLCVTILPGEERDGGRETALGALVLRGGGLVFATPAGVDAAASLEHIAIGWDASAEAGRAMRASVGLLKAARSVTLIHLIEHTRDAAPPVLEATHYLEAHGISARVHVVPCAGRAHGVALLEEVTATGARALVMGAFGRAQWLEQVFGGATNHAVRAARVPLILAH